MATPIRSEDIVNVLPDGIIETFNHFIQVNYDGREAVVYQDSVVKAVSEKMNLTSQEIYQRHYLDIEAIYEKYGWKVQYEKPDFNGCGRAHFIFTRA